MVWPFVTRNDIPDNCTYTYDRRRCQRRRIYILFPSAQAKAIPSKAVSFSRQTNVFCNWFRCILLRIFCRQCISITLATTIHSHKYCNPYGANFVNPFFFYLSHTTLYSNDQETYVGFLRDFIDVMNKLNQTTPWHHQVARLWNLGSVFQGYSTWSVYM